MWRMSIAELSNRTVYRGQKLLFMGTIKATVKNVFTNGQSTHSGYFSSLTKPVFRSESARYTLFIQMSKEMWDFDAEGAGEIMFNKVVNGFLPDLFKRWLRINARHLVTIILFTRMQYDPESTPKQPNDTTDSKGFGSRTDRFRDYYRVVVSDMASGDWVNILYQLKKEFRSFLKDVSLIPRQDCSSSTAGGATSGHPKPQLVIAGKPSSAAQGNILEAINLAGAQFAKDYIDRDLVRTGISIIVVTAGTGVFEVDYNMLKLTTDTLVGSGIGIDLVCLSSMPLHSVPLFKYRSPRSMSSLPEDASDNQDQATSGKEFDNYDEKTPRQYQPNFGSVIRRSPPQVPPINIRDSPDAQDQDQDQWRYAMPHWVDISFWSGPFEEILELAKVRRSEKIVRKVQKKSGSFALRCRMYELQMMGVMENELGDISIPYLEEDPLYPQRLRERIENPSITIPTRDAQGVSEKVPSNDTEKRPVAQVDDIHKLHESWMDEFDSSVFTPRIQKSLRHSQTQLARRPSLLTAKSDSAEHAMKSSYLASSYRSVVTPYGKASRLHPGMGSPQAMRGISGDPDASPRMSAFQTPEYSGPGVPHADVLARKMAGDQMSSVRRRPLSHRRGGSGDSSDQRSSRYSTPRDSPAPSRGQSPPKGNGPPPLVHPSTATSVTNETNPTRWFLRQINFGGKKAATPKATTEAAIGQATIDITPGKVKLARLTSGGVNHTGPIAEKLASTRVEKSQPIAIRSVSRAGLSSDESSSPGNAGRSVETVRGFRSMKTSIPSHPGSVIKDPGSTFLLAGSRALGDSVPPKPDLNMMSTSGGAKEIPRTLSPTSAIAPWAVLVNPCNPKKNNISVASQFRRWQHVFPKRLKTASVKWKSLCSPAAVPLTNEYFPTLEQLATEYNENPYKITQNDDEEMLEAPKSRESLVRELIAFRLSHGFQIIVGALVAEFSGRRELDLSNIFDANYMSSDGDTVFLSIGNNIHQLVCIAGGEVEIKRYSRKPTTALQSSAGIDTPFPYRPYIRTAFEDNYEPRNVILHPPRKEYNWNFIDTFLAGYQDEFSEVLRFWRARFVLIPVELPTINRRPLPMLAEDSEEEIRLEGIRKLTQVWQKYRYVPPEERHFQATNSRRQKDPNPLAIEYQTRDPSAIVAAGADNSLIDDTDSEFLTSIFSETEQYQTSNIDIKKLAEDIQGESGIPMLDRRWHMRLHYNCFLGFDLTSWLLSNFKDVETRDEAVDLGNQLMRKGLFVHVQKRHAFRDGNFFYSVAPEYRTPRPETKTSWFGIRKSDRSVPSTPLLDGPRASPLATRSLRSRPSTSDTSSTNSGEDGGKTPTRSGTPKRKVLLSRVMRYDVDPRKRSYRPEIISLHYDRLSNPDNCYHIRIDWMNVTAKLIEDAIVSWATSVEKYGLKLVEVPIAEASNIADHHPFREPYIIKLALQPPQTHNDVRWDSSHFSTQYAKNDKFAYHKALLRRLNFVLDLESADSFPADVEVAYSWGSPDYKYTQFIHKSGTLMAQILHDGNFAVLANRLAHNRAKDTSRFRPTDPYEHKRAVNDKDRMPTTPAERANPHRSPFSSPLARPVQDSSLLHSALQALPSATPTPITATSASAATGMTQTPERVKDELEAFCSNATLLQAFYATEVFKQAPHHSPSPRILPVLDNNIPNLGLPPAVFVSGASPATSPWSLSGSVISGSSTIAGRRQGSDEGHVSAGGSIRPSLLGAMGSRRRSVALEETMLPKRSDSQSSSGTG